MTAVLGWPLAVALRTGSLSIPHNDAWSHSKIAQHFARTGTIELVGWNRSSLIGQIVPLGPLGASIAAQQLFVLMTGAVALVSAYLLVRRVAGSGPALLAVATLGVAPDFGLLSTSFMADVPALAGTLAAAALGQFAIRRRSAAWLVASVALGLWAATIRDQAVAVVAAVLLVALWKWSDRRRVPLLLGTVAGIVFVAFELWRRSLPNGDPPVFSPDPLNAVTTLLDGGLALGLYALPVTLLVARPWAWRPASWLAAVAVCVIGLLYLSSDPARPLLGNYLQRTGAYTAASIGRHWALEDGRVWFPILALAVLGAAAAVATLIHLRPRLDPVLAVLAVLTVLGTLGQALSGQQVFARYLLGLVVVLFVWLLGGTAADEPAARPVAARLPAAAGLALLAGLSMAITALTLAYDSARWEAASTLVARGVPATDIDAGLEWVGYHATTAADQTAAPRRTAMSRQVRMFPRSRSCYLVAGSRLPRELVSTYRYPTAAFFGSGTLYLYRTGVCPPVRLSPN